MNQEQFNRLPAYARHEIEKLRADLDFWKETALQVEDENTNLEWRFGSDSGYLPEHITIMFHTQSGDISARLSQGLLSLGSSSGRLVVFPRASNAVLVAAE